MYVIKCLMFLYIVEISFADQRAKCIECYNLTDEEVCASDKNTYPSYCILKQTACLTGKDIKFECNGKCPCDPPEIQKIDPTTVNALKNLRLRSQLNVHKHREEYENEQFLFGNDAEQKVMEEFVLKNTVKVKKEDKECSKSQLLELPYRLVDWFHVLKTNEREQSLAEKGENDVSPLIGIKFIKAKFDSIVTLSCKLKGDELQDPVCLKPVQWMFEHLDVDKSEDLSLAEMEEIEDVDHEHCIKLFLENCDNNLNGVVNLNEFCKCLCYTPPCTHAMQSVPTKLTIGIPKPVAGFFIPYCDEDGFFMPKQCNKHRGECWCVNRNGAEFFGTRTKNELKCSDNTKESDLDAKELVPLDLERENV